MKQFVQLQEYYPRFREAGISIVALTYDSPADQQAFVDKYGITYPFLSDIDAATVKALDILNDEYQPGDSVYGIPHPGIFVVDAGQRIVGKLFVERYALRVDAASVLDYAQAALDQESVD